IVAEDQGPHSTVAASLQALPFERATGLAVQVDGQPQVGSPGSATSEHGSMLYWRSMEAPRRAGASRDGPRSVQELDGAGQSLIRNPYALRLAGRAETVDLQPVTGGDEAMGASYFVLRVE